MQSRRAGAVGLVVGLLASCAGTSAPQCRVDADCGANNTCLQTRACAPRCGATPDCATGQFCSAAKGCVPVSGCGHDADCQNGAVCEGTCVQPCKTTGCPNGVACLANGHCEKPVIPGTLPTDSCGGELFDATHVEANMLLVLDQSCSMKDPVAGTPKWDTATAAVRSVTQANDTRIRFGLNMFPGADKCSQGTQPVAVAAGASGAISSAMPAAPAGNGTPIGAALKVAAGSAGLKDTDRANYVLLVTDGMENCSGKPVDEVKKLFTAGIKTYVVGFGGEVDPARLSEMAVAGGTARLGQTKYYQADDTASLTAALAAIAQGAIGCDFKLAKAPPDVNKIFVAVNGTLVPQDPNRVAGWAFDAANFRLTLFGPACDLVTRNANAKVQIVYGCPDPTIIETPVGNDGGFLWDTDGGEWR